mmetsp:Transcript_38060/g.119867  ORF Transcript_38060/g.119867 Transcript_38060/m.119867 type:complete len:163 (+) Transcript_38060:1084-1572(+)
MSSVSTKTRWGGGRDDDGGAGGDEEGADGGGSGEGVGEAEGGGGEGEAEGGGDREGSAGAPAGVAGGGEGGEGDDGGGDDGDAKGGRDGGGDTGGWQPTMSGEYRCALNALVVQPALLPDRDWRPGSSQFSRMVGALPSSPDGGDGPSGFAPGTCHTRRTSE